MVCPYRPPSKSRIHGSTETVLASLTVGRTPTLATAGRSAPSGRMTLQAYTPKAGERTPSGRARLAVGVPRVLPSSAPWTTGPDRMWGWPRKRTASSISPWAMRARMWVEDTVTPSSSTRGTMSQPRPSSPHSDWSRWGVPSPR